MKEKWKNLKDTYRKYKKSEVVKTGQAAKKLKKWVWAKSMEFLDTTINMRPTESTPLEPLNLNNEASDLSFSNDKVELQSCSQGCQQIMSPGDQPHIEHSDWQDTDEAHIGLPIIGNSRRKRRAPDAADKMIAYLQSKKKERKTCPENVDKIDYLFLNYSDTFKKFLPRRQAKVKLQLAKLFAEAEMDDIDEREASQRESYSPSDDSVIRIIIPEEQVLNTSEATRSPQNILYPYEN